MTKPVDEHNAGAASAEARAFLAAALGESATSPRRETIAAYRDETAAEFRPRAERMLARHPVTHRDTTIGGTPCIEVMPNSGPPVGTILYCYGGGFVCGSAFEDLIIAAPLAAHAKVRVVLPKYPLAPEHPWPAPVDAGYAAYRGLMEDSGNAPLAIAGESAGGNMALSILLRLQKDGLELPVAAALLSPWCDLVHGGDSLTANDGRDPTLMLSWVDVAAGMYGGDNDLAQPDISPLNGRFDASFPPTVITTGTRDLLMSQGVRLSRVLREAGIPVDLHVWDDLWHVFEFYDEIPEADASVREIATFLNKQLKVRSG